MSINTAFLPKVAPVASSRRQPKTIQLGIALAIAMAFTIAGTVTIGKSIAFISIPFFVIAVVVYSLTNPAKALGVLAAYSAMEGMYKYLSGYSQIVYVIKPILGATVLVGMLLSYRHTNQRMKMPPLAGLVGILAVWCLVMIFQPLGDGPIGGLATALVWYLVPIICLFTSFNASKTSHNIETIAYAYIGVTVIVSLFTIVQYALGQSWTEAHLPGYSSMNEGIWWIENSRGQITALSFRPASTTAIGGDGGQWSVLGIIVSLGLLLSPKVTPSRKVLLGICLLALTTGLVCCATRIFLISAIISVIALFVITAKSPSEMGRNLALLLLVGLTAWAGLAMAQVASGGLVGNRYQETLQNPLAKYDHDRGGVGGRSMMIYNQMSQYPLGLGYQRGTNGESELSERDDGGQVTSAPVENRDDEFSAISDDLGIPGLIILLALFIATLSRGWLILQRLRDPHLRLLAAILLVLLFSTIVMSFAGPAIASNNEFWLFCGCLFALPAIEAKERLPHQNKVTI